MESRTSEKQTPCSYIPPCFKITCIFKMLQVLFISISSMPSNTQQRVKKISFKIKDILFTEIDHVYKHNHFRTEASNDGEGNAHFKQAQFVSK